MQEHKKRLKLYRRAL